MIKEYRSIQEVAGPLMLVTGVEGVKYDELGEIELANGETRRCKVLEVNGDSALVAAVRNHGGRKNQLGVCDDNDILFMKKLLSGNPSVVHNNTVCASIINDIVVSLLTDNLCVALGNTDMGQHNIATCVATDFDFFFFIQTKRIPFVIRFLRCKHK